jgi:hypothetical protein
MSKEIVEWCRKQQKRLESEGKPYSAKLFGLMAAYFKSNRK